ncbi:hypothetical protein M271_10700 [Streptomyces rapamycinicus NRRL 5491]|nr:hypothetical protein M271_10700 [Streptomyces rapamycinicus NRRL 5491]
MHWSVCFVNAEGERVQSWTILDVQMAAMAAGIDKSRFKRKN